MSKKLLVTCPECGCELEVDSSTGAIITHKPKKEKKGKLDFDARLKQMKAEKERAEKLMEQAFKAEQEKKRLLEERFKELMKNTDKESVEPGIRDIDLD